VFDCLYTLWLLSINTTEPRIEVLTIQNLLGRADTLKGQGERESSKVQVFCVAAPCELVK
jgi:hypothetical protein